MKNEESVSTQTDRPPKRRGFKMFLLLLVSLICLSGLGWKYWDLHTEFVEANNKITEMNKEIRKEKIGKSLLKTLVESSRGEYDLAISDANDFFSRLNEELGKGEESAFPQERHQGLKTIGEYRDGVIAALARHEGEAAKRMDAVYEFYLRATGEFKVSADRKVEVKTNESNSNSENQNTGISNLNDRELPQTDNSNTNSENSNSNLDRGEPKTKSGNKNVQPNSNSTEKNSKGIVKNSIHREGAQRIL